MLVKVGSSFAYNSLGVASWRSASNCNDLYSRFPSSPLIIRVLLFLLFGLTKGTQKEKGQKGATTGEPSISQGSGKDSGYPCVEFWGPYMRLDSKHQKLKDQTSQSCMMDIECAGLNP